jgi:hypothetical protein
MTENNTCIDKRTRYNRSIEQRNQAIWKTVKFSSLACVTTGGILMTVIPLNFMLTKMNNCERCFFKVGACERHYTKILTFLTGFSTSICSLFFLSYKYGKKGYNNYKKAKTFHNESFKILLGE